MDEFDDELSDLADADWLPIPDGLWRHIPWNHAPAGLRRYVRFTAIHPDGVHLMPWKRIPVHFHPVWLTEWQARDPLAFTPDVELEELEAFEELQRSAVPAATSIGPSMTSRSLTALGFGRWFPFSLRTQIALLAALPIEPGVYAIRFRNSMARARGHSDILYVGSATNSNGLQGRIRQYFSPGPTQQTNLRILARCGHCDDYELSFATCLNGEGARALEAAILSDYMRVHGELTPENRVLPMGNQTSSSGEPEGPVRAPDLPSVATLMFEEISAAPMSPATRVLLERMRDGGDSDGILRFVERCVRDRPDVGRSVNGAGRVSFESRLKRLREIASRGRRPSGRSQG